MSPDGRRSVVRKPTESCTRGSTSFTQTCILILDTDQGTGETNAQGISHQPSQREAGRFISSLLEGRTGYSDGFLVRVQEGILTETMTALEASNIIEWMLKLPKVTKPAPTTTTGDPLEPGFWIGDGDPDGINVWKVQKTRDGERTYAKKLVVHVEHTYAGEERRKGGPVRARRLRRSGQVQPSEVHLGGGPVVRQGVRGLRPVRRSSGGR